VKCFNGTVGLGTLTIVFNRKGHNLSDTLAKFGLTRKNLKEESDK